MSIAGNFEDAMTDALRHLATIQELAKLSPRMTDIERQELELASKTLAEIKESVSELEYQFMPQGIPIQVRK